MILRDIVGNYPIENVYGEMNKEIKGINHDSRKIEAGDIFIAQKGFKVDGHKYIGEAIKNGAIAILLEDYKEAIEGLTIIKVKDSTDALAWFSRNFYGDPSKKIKLIGITGTNGKTSTSYYLKSILENNNKKTAIIGTIGGKIGNIQLKLDNTTPDALLIQRYLAQMLENGIEYCVMEVSSHALALKRAEYIDFYSAIFTNLSVDHLDYHKDMENYYLSKEKLFYYTNGSHVINMDDEYGKRLISTFSDKRRIFTYSIKEKANVYATDIQYFINGTKFLLNTPSDKIEISLNTAGEFSVYNALAAATCAYSMSININTIKSGLESIANVPGRFEILKINKDFTIIIDFAHTPDGLEKVLKTIKALAKARVIVVFGAGGNRDRSKRPQMGQIAGENADFAIITSDNPRFEDPLKIINDIEVGINKTKIEYITIVSRKKAIEYAFKIAKTNDIILLAGKGHETYTIIGDTIYDLDERKVIENLICTK